MSETKPTADPGAVAARREEEVEAPDAGFACVRISELFSPRKVAFDLYLRLGEGRYLRIFRAGENFDENELKAYEVERGMRYVYFGRENRGSYVTSSLTLLQKITALPAVPIRTKFGVARILSELYIQSVLEAGEEGLPELVEKGREICASVAALVDTHPGLERCFLQLDQVDANVPAQSFLTGLFACLLANRFPWKSRRMSENLLLASFHADIGLRALPPELQRLRLKRMNVQQKRQYEKHPEASYLLLSELGMAAFNDTVLTVVRQHHEYCDGTGYPKGLPGDKILQLSKLVSLCGDVVRTASEFLLPPGDAARVIFPDFTEKLFKEYPDVVAKYETDFVAALIKALMAAAKEAPA